MIIFENNLYIGRNGILSCCDLLGKEIWKKELPDRVLNDFLSFFVYKENLLVGSNGSVFTISSTGDILIIDKLKYLGGGCPTFTSKNSTIDLNSTILFHFKEYYQAGTL